MNLLVTHAIEEESFFLNFSGHSIRTVITGCGKANSAAKLMESVCMNRPDAVINIGTSGTRIHNVGDILVCRKFIDRDFENLTLPGLKNFVDFSDESLATNWASVVDGKESREVFMVNTGDNFVTADSHFTGDAIDMEAFAQALICNDKQIPFVSVKYITDIVGRNTKKQWEDKLVDAQHALCEYFKDKEL